ncbi:MAG TPA: prephenate dehydrogenase/arogenate dehydrogenase family protein [Polyangiaceae bacterium]|nr:prephenate dehydrogenase/arogenate dehydrogenase family protein [Polyangiaceae bacterium]
MEPQNRRLGGVLCYPASGMLGHVTIVGCGLIGGSLVKALRARKGAQSLSVVDRDGVVSAAMPYVDDAASIGSARARELVSKADLVVLAMPVFAIIQSLDWVLGAIQDTAVVTDTGSVKVPVLEAAGRHARSARFVPGHPMAGREVGGFDAAAVDLFDNARWFVVEGADRDACSRAFALARSVGAEPKTIDAGDHDRAMAFVSHAPQVVASALYAAAAAAGVLGEAGPGFRDSTRIAGGGSSMWRDIIETNGPAIGAALAHILAPLDRLRDKLTQGDASAVAEAMSVLEAAQMAKVKSAALRGHEGEPGR